MTDLSAKKIRVDLTFMDLRICWNGAAGMGKGPAWSEPGVRQQLEVAQSPAPPTLSVSTCCSVPPGNGWKTPAPSVPRAPARAPGGRGLRARAPRRNGLAGAARRSLRAR